jgi:hypothetical protein
MVTSPGKNATGRRALIPHKRVIFALTPRDNTAPISMAPEPSPPHLCLHNVRNTPVRPCLHQSKSRILTVMNSSFRLRVQTTGREMTLCVPPRVLEIAGYLSETVSPSLREKLSKEEFELITKGFEVSWTYRDKVMRYIIYPMDGVLADARLRVVFIVVLEGQMIWLKPILPAERMQSWRGLPCELSGVK